MSDDANALTRQRRAEDPVYRAREAANRARYRARKKAAKAGAPIPADVAKQKGRPEDPCDKWLRDGILLNSDDLDQAAAAGRVHRQESSIPTS
jgi:hypothetical protein